MKQYFPIILLILVLSACVPKGIEPVDVSAVMELSVKSLDFGTVTVGSSKGLSITIRNIGTGSLQIKKVQMPIGYKVIIEPNGEIPEIPPKSSRTVDVLFIPNSEGDYSGFPLRFISNSSSSQTNIIQLTGKGVGSAITPLLLTGDLDFDSVSIGKTSTQYLAIENISNTVYQVEKFTFDVAGFSCNWTGDIYPNNRVFIPITFSPSSIGAVVGTLSVYVLGQASINNIPVRGIGTETAASIIQMNGNLHFGTVELGNTKTQFLNIFNVGNESFHISNILLPYGFTISSTGTGTVPPDGQIQVKISFRPENIGICSGYLTVFSNATSGNSTIVISGIGKDNQTVLPPLAGYWSFDDCTLKDHSNHFPKGDFSNNAYEECKIGLSSFSFLLHPNSGFFCPANTNETHSISFWSRMQLSSANNIDKVFGFSVIDEISTQTFDVNLGHDYTENQTKVYIDGANSGNLSYPTFQTTTALCDNEWHHYVYTHSGMETKIYIDNQLVNQFDLPYSKLYGLRVFSGFNTHNIDEIRLYNEALDEYQVATLYINRE